jgi:hypothetical protein
MATGDANTSNDNGNLKTNDNSNQQPTSGQLAVPLERAMNRLFRFSIRSAGVAISSPLPKSGGTDHYPYPPSLTLGESRGRCLPVRASRIAVCPVSGDLLVVDVGQSLIQVDLIS